MPTNLIRIKDKLFESIFDHAPNGIAIIGLDFGWVKVNRRMTELLGYSETEFYAFQYPYITHKDDVALDVQQLNKLLNNEINSYQIEKRYFHKEGAIIWTLHSVSMQRDPDGTPLYFIAQIVDITKQKSMLWEMHSIAEIVKNQNDKLKDFAHIATHDIRSHLGNLGMITGFMEEELKEIKHNENFKMLKECLTQLELTITHLNEVRKENFSLKNSLKPKVLSAFVERAIYNTNAIARQANCEIINEVEGQIEVLALAVYLDSIILNLLTNAIKYCSKERPSYVKLRSTIMEDFVILEVSDNGLGIDLAKHQSDLFQFEKTFHQREDSRGIGLFITKNHIESMGGKIEVESQVDIGSTFKVYLKKR